MTCGDGTKRTLLVGYSIIGENILVSLVDITDRKKAEAEKEKLQSQLLQSQKLEAVGILAGGVAHDFNNMLGAIMGYAELTLDDMDPDHRFRKNLTQILDAAKRSVGLTRQLLIFARKQETIPITFEVNDAVKNTIKMIRRLIGENIELVWMPGDGPYHIKMDPTHFDQILTNLFVNAKDAISDIGKITVETRSVLVDTEPGMSHAELVPGDYVRLSVTDTGGGIEQEVLAHIFEPFFSTKGLGEGTGLGLATVYGIVKQNGGMVNVDSEVGIGTTFIIYLPLYSGAEQEQDTAENIEIPRSRGETILIVEDDPFVLEMSSAMLKRLGYNILRADTPGEAMGLAEAQIPHIHMVITDMIMPEMNGKDLARRLSEISPGIKTLFMSGYTANIISGEEITDNQWHFIRKPFSIGALAVKIREVLEAD